MFKKKLQNNLIVWVCLICNSHSLAFPGSLPGAKSVEVISRYGTNVRIVFYVRTITWNLEIHSLDLFGRNNS